MDLKQSTIEAILDSERELVDSAPERYPEYFTHTYNVSAFLNEFLINLKDPNKFLFRIFLGHIRKHYLLAMLSAVRLHGVQTAANTRQLLEAGVAAAYSLANEDITDFVKEDKEGFLVSSKKNSVKHYKWLNDNFKTASDIIKNFKDSINSSAHANVIYAMKTFPLDESKGEYQSSFFDFEDELDVKKDLWLLANATLGLLHLFFRVNLTRDIIQFSPGFSDRLEKELKESEKLKENALMEPRIKKVQEKK